MPAINRIKRQGPRRRLVKTSDLPKNAPSSPSKTGSPQPEAHPVSDHGHPSSTQQDDDGRGPIDSVVDQPDNTRQPDPEPLADDTNTRTEPEVLSETETTRGKRPLIEETQELDHATKRPRLSGLAVDSPILSLMQEALATVNPREDKIDLSTRGHKVAELLTQGLVELVPLLHQAASCPPSVRSIPALSKQIEIVQGTTNHLTSQRNELMLENKSLRVKMQEQAARHAQEVEALKAQLAAAQADHATEKSRVAIAAATRARQLLWKTSFGQLFLSKFKDQVVEDYKLSPLFLKDVQSLGVDYFKFAVEKSAEQAVEDDFMELDVKKIWDAMPKVPAGFKGDPNLPESHEWWSHTLEKTLAGHEKLKQCFDLPVPHERPLSLTAAMIASTKLQPLVLRDGSASSSNKSSGPLGSTTDTPRTDEASQKEKTANAS